MKKRNTTNHDEIIPPTVVPPLQRRSSFSDLDNEDDVSRRKNSIELVDAASKDKPKEPVTLKKVLTRSATAVVAFSLYLALLSAGHLYCIIALMLVQVLNMTFSFCFNVFNEVLPIIDSNVQRNCQCSICCCERAIDAMVPISTVVMVLSCYVFRV